MSLAQADTQPSAVNVIFPGGPALPEEDIAEEGTIKSIFDLRLSRLLFPNVFLDICKVQR